MADKKDDVVIDVEERWERIEDYFVDNKKPISIIATIVVVLVLGFVGVKFWYIPGQEQDAEMAMYRAQAYFSEDSINKAIKGDASNLGFESIADQYSWTPAGHLANYYLGVCYYSRKEYQKSLDYLEKFDAGDILVSANAAGVMGDDEMQLGNKDKALEYYLEAVKRSDNKLTAPLYLKKAAFVSEQTNNFAQAVALYQRIKTEYYTSQEAQDIDKYIYRAKAKGGIM
ncbi:MAG TPA: tetratricopeptide repeat protein [Bacteroidia bacterium]|nr:tetratricopeptide repeat protein [Bacteroidia bacterium]